MIIRARPKFLYPADVDDVLRRSTSIACHVDGTVFFNSGRSALTFLLSECRLQAGRPMVVALQSFNCAAVCEAVIASGNTAHLVDVNVTDFSVTLDIVRNMDVRLDALVLTHYQGIPNQQYKAIAGYCRDNGILLIEDLAQAEGSTIGGVEVGCISDFYFKSHAFDKPLSCGQGGSLSWTEHTDKTLLKAVLCAHENLPEEDNSTAVKDLHVLRRLLIWSSEDRYTPAVKWFFRIFGNATGGLSLIQPCRLNMRKVALLDIQRKRYSPEGYLKEVRALETFLRNNGCAVSAFADSSIHWNRYAVVCEGRLPEDVYRHVEIANYNWPHPLHRLYRDHPQVNKPHSYGISDFLSKRILNIPVWSEYFQRQNGH